ncbi:hypothetical protein [Leifsonia sp. P73]|uniref:hypothetical protein n=1 Tax=Leifsonia sp. P73 TaxID=3423959 RepID=UPI003DA2685F
MARHNLSTVIGFEFTRTIKKRSFWAVTLILPILVFGLGALVISANVSSANTADQQKNARFDFLYVDASGLVDPAVASSYGGKEIASSSEGWKRCRSAAPRPSSTTRPTRRSRPSRSTGPTPACSRTASTPPSRNRCWRRAWSRS